MTATEHAIRLGLRAGLDREIDHALGRRTQYDRDDLADAMLEEVLDHLQRHKIALVPWPTAETAGTVVLPTGIDIDATSVQIDRWTWVYLPHYEGQPTEETALRIILAPAWMARLHHLRHGHVDGLWIIAAGVWTLSATIGRFSPRLAMHLDRLACAVEAIADGEPIEEDL